MWWYERSSKDLKWITEPVSSEWTAEEHGISECEHPSCVLFTSRFLRVLSKFAFSLSQDCELPAKKDVSYDTHTHTTVHMLNFYVPYL